MVPLRSLVVDNSGNEKNALENIIRRHLGVNAYVGISGRVRDGKSGLAFSLGRSIVNVTAQPAVARRPRFAWLVNGNPLDLPSISGIRLQVMMVNEGSIATLKTKKWRVVAMQAEHFPLECAIKRRPSNARSQGLIGATGK